HQLAADLFKYARCCRVEVKDRKEAALSLDLEAISDSAVVAGLTPHAEGGRRAAIDQRLEEPRLFKGLLGGQHRDTGLVGETEGDRLIGHQCTAARERRPNAMNCEAKIFQ